MRLTTTRRCTGGAAAAFALSAGSCPVPSSYVMYPNSAMNVASEPTTTGVALGFRGRGRGRAASGSLRARVGSVIRVLRAVVAAVVVLALVLATTAGGAAGARADRCGVADGRGQ